MLYSTSWLDLGDEPIVLSVPEMCDRYYMMQLLDMMRLLDAWTNVFVGASGGGTAAMIGDESGATQTHRLPYASIPCFLRFLITKLTE
jgi:hypothetical protein